MVYWKRFTVKNDIWKKEEDLENTRETVEEFKRRMNTEVRRQEKLNRLEKRNFRRGELPEKYIAKMLYKWDDRSLRKNI